jgi:hypothetical protein
LNLMYSYLLYKGKEYILPEYHDSQEKLRCGDRNLENNNNNSIKDDERNNESHPSENFFGKLRYFLDIPKKLFSKWKRYSNEDINFGVECDINEHNPTDINDEDEFNPTAKLDPTTTTNVDKVDPTNTVVSSDPVTPLQIGGISSMSSDHRNMRPSVDIIIAGFVSVFIGYLIYKLLRETRSTQRRLWIKYFMNNSEFWQIDELQQKNEKGKKILEIKEKLPVIIKNVEILDQFWGNQVINIKSHIETLSSVDENEKIRFPKQVASPINENWNKQQNESKANYIRMKDLVTHNSLLSIDVSILGQKSA